MNTKTTLPISKARKKIFKSEEFESWQETLELMNIFPNLEKDIKKAEKEYKRGDHSTIEDVLAKEGFILANKLKK